MSLGTYTTMQLLQTVTSLQQVPRFLVDFFFPGVVTFDTEKISFDIESENLKLAPFVSPVVAGKAVKGRGHSTKEFKPAYIKPKHQVDPTMPLVRRPGEAFGGAMSAGQRRNLVIAQLLQDQRDQILRRLEWMAAQILTTGAVTVVGDDYPETEVDFGRDEDLTDALTGGARWGETGVSPFKDVDTWADEVSGLVGAGIDTVVMGKDAWGYYAEDPKVDRVLDRTRGQNALIDLGYQTGAPGAPQFKGTIGDISFYTYNGVYQDDDGETQSMLDPLGVILGAREAHGGLKCYGAILDGSAGYQPAEIWPKHWVENDPPIEFVMSQSAPLLVPRRPNATSYRKVR